MWEVEYTDEFEQWWHKLNEHQHAFDPRRCAILLIGGDKTGDDRFYEKMIPLADRLYDEHLKELKDEGLI
jgi:hypothetical protein